MKLPKKINSNFVWATKSGAVYTGSLTSHDRDHLYIRHPSGADQRVLKSDVASIRRPIQPDRIPIDADEIAAIVFAVDSDFKGVIEIKPPTIPEKESVYVAEKNRVAGELIANNRHWLTLRQRDGGLLHLRSDSIEAIRPPEAP